MHVNPKSIKFVKMTNTALNQILSLSSTADLTLVEDKKLCIEVGSHFYSYSITDQSGKQIHRFACFALGRPVLAEDLKALFDQDAINSTILETIHGDLQAREVMEDDVHQWELFNVYGWLPEIVNTVADQFPQMRHVQFMTTALRSLFKSLSVEKEQLIKLYFYQNEMIAVVLKDSQLQLAQAFHFDTPQDVIW
jgi:hypothetical protein